MEGENKQRQHKILIFKLYRLHPVVYLSYVTAVNTTNNAGISSMKTTDVGIYFTYFM
jgi:hypothetical protein